MMDWTEFDSVFRSKPDYSFDQKQIDAIIKNRKELGGILYFDRIWNSIGLKQPQKSYPPKSNNEIRSIWQKIAKAEVLSAKKQAVLFYILRDCKQLNNIDNIFAQEVFLSTKYQILVAGLWELDHLQFNRALENLTDPSLTPEFADDILLTLLTSPTCEPSSAIAYYLTVHPPLSKQETLQAYFKLLIQSNVVEAYHFCSKRDVTQHKMLFEELLRWIHEEKTSTAKATRIVTLLSIPFTEEEEHWFEDYLLRGHGSRIAGGKDSVLIHRLVIGRSISDLGSLDRHRGQKLNDINWDDIRVATKAAIT